MLLTSAMMLPPATANSEHYHDAPVRTAPIFKPLPIPNLHRLITHHGQEGHKLISAYLKDSLTYQLLDPTDYDDGKPSLFAPAIDKPFERARTLTGGFYMPELAFQRGQPIYGKKVYISKSKPLRPKPIAVSGVILPVGIPVSLGSPSFIARSYGGYSY